MVGACSRIGQESWYLTFIPFTELNLLTINTYVSKDNEWYSNLISELR